MKGSAPVGPEAVVRMVKISAEAESRMGLGMEESRQVEGQEVESEKALFLPRFATERSDW